MTKSTPFEIDLLGLIFNGTAITNVASNISSSSPITALWLSLHTSDPGEAATQGTNETSYTGYTRISVTRSTAGWVVSTADGSANPVSAVNFPQATSTSTGTITHAAVGQTSASTGGKLFYSGAISPNINFGQGVSPQLTTASAITED